MNPVCKIASDIIGASMLTFMTFVVGCMILWPVVYVSVKIKGLDIWFLHTERQFHGPTTLND